MKAVVFYEFGAPDVLQVGELAEPVAQSGEVAVRISASTVNPTDLMMRSGAQASMMQGLTPPYIPGMEFSGHICALGAGVKAEGIGIGQPVVGVVNPRRPRGGSNTEIVVVPVASVTPISHNVDLVGAATIPMNAVTATLALNMIDLKPGQVLLVTGGSGMLGGSVLQLARGRKCTVVATGLSQDANLLTSLGADVIIRRDGDMIAQMKQLFPQGVDALIDGALIGQQLVSVVRNGGAAVSLRKSHPIEDERLKVQYVSVLNGMEDTEIIRSVGRSIDEGRLIPRVADVGPFPMSEAVEAHRVAEKGGLKGRIVLTF